MKVTTRALAVLWLAGLGIAQDLVNGPKIVLGRLSSSGANSSVDFTQAGSTAPVKTGTLAARPGGCIQGQMYNATDAAAGQNLYFCTTTGTPGTWTLQGGSGGSGAAPYISSLISGPDSTTTITGATHGFATTALLVAVYDNASPRNAIQASWTVNASTYDVAVAFASPQSDYYVVVNGGRGPMGPRGFNGSAGPCTLASSLGFALNGTDEATLLNSTFAAWYAAGGGCLAIDAGKTLRADGQIVLPNSGSAPWNQPPIRITGSVSVNGYGDQLHAAGTYPVGGSRLDLRYAGGPKILTLGSGTMEIDHITLVDGASDCAPFVQTTFTVLKIHDASFFGTTASNGSTYSCNDAIILGGTNAYNAGFGGTIADAFQGYGTVIRDNFFQKIKRNVVLQSTVNGVTIASNTNGRDSGNNTGAKAVYDVQGNAALPNQGNIFRDNVIEVEHYTCGINLHIASGNFFSGNSFWDQSGAKAYCGDSTATRNSVDRMVALDAGVSLTNSTWDPNNYMPYRVIPFSFDGGGAALTGTTTRCTLVPFGGSINQFAMQADQAGTATVTVKSVALASYTGPNSATDISNGGETMTSSTAKTDTTLTGWTTTLPPQTMVCVSLSSPSTVTWVSGSIQVYEGR